MEADRTLPPRSPAASQFATDYMPSLYEALKSQHDAASQVPGCLEQMKIVMEDAKREADRQETQAIIALAAIVAEVVAAIIVAAATRGAGAAFVGPIVGAIIMTLFWFIQQIVQIAAVWADRIRELGDQVKNLQEILKREKKTIDPPPPPRITSPGFSMSGFFPAD